MPTTQTRGDLLKALRNERGLKQKQVAQAIGVENQSISLWENDKVDISPANLLKLVEFYGVDPSVLGYEMPGTLPAAGMPEWFRQWSEQLFAEISDLKDEVRAK